MNVTSNISCEVPLIFKNIFYWLQQNSLNLFSQNKKFKQIQKIVRLCDIILSLCIYR